MEFSSHSKKAYELVNKLSSKDNLEDKASGLIGTVWKVYKTYLYKRNQNTYFSMEYIVRTKRYRLAFSEFREAKRNYIQLSIEHDIQNFMIINNDRMQIGKLFLLII